MVVETEVFVSEDISTEVQQVEPSPTPCLVTWGRLTITKTPVFRDNTEEQDRSTGKEESRFDGKSARGERSTEDLYKRKILEKRTLEESSSRGEIFCGKKSKVTIEDVSSEEPRNVEEDFFQVEPIVEEEEEERLLKSPQRKESVVIEELLDDISEGKENNEDKENGSNLEERERVHTEADLALRDMIERCKTGDLPKLPLKKGSVIIEELLDDISEGEDKNEDGIGKEAKLKKETVGIVTSPKSLLSGTKLETSVPKQGRASNEERRNIQIMEKSPVVELSEVSNSGNAKEEEEVEVNEDRIDKVNVVAVEGSVDTIGLIDSVGVFGNQKRVGEPEDQEGFRMESGDAETKLMAKVGLETDQCKNDTKPTMRDNFVRVELSSRNSSKEYFGSPEREIIHTEADIALRKMIERCNKGEVAEEGLLVERKKLETENVESHKKGDKMLKEALVVKKILKEYGEEEEENSEHVLLGFEHQDQSRNLVRLLLLLLLLLLPILLLPQILLPSHPTSCTHQEEASGGGEANRPTSGSCSLDGYLFLSSLP